MESYTLPRSGSIVPFFYFFIVLRGWRHSGTRRAEFRQPHQLHNFFILYFLFRRTPDSPQT